MELPDEGFMVVWRLRGRDVQREVVSALDIVDGKRACQVGHGHGIEALHGERLSSRRKQNNRLANDCRRKRRGETEKREEEEEEEARRGAAGASAERGEIAAKPAEGRLAEGD